MKMIEVLSLIAKGKIENNTELIADTDLDSHWYTYSTGKHAFFDKHLARIEEDFFLDKDFLNLEVELRPPKEKKYRIKLPNTELYIFLCKDEDDEIKIYTFEKDTPIIEIFIRAAEACRLKYKTEFTEQDFEEIEELKPYEQFKELVKDDENE